MILGDSSAGATSTVTVSFTVDGGIQWPPWGAIKVVFPAGFDVSNTGAAGVDGVQGVDGGFSFTSSQRANLKRFFLSVRALAQI